MTFAGRLFLIAFACLGWASPASADSRVVWMTLDHAVRRAESPSSPARTISPSPGEQARLWLVEHLDGFAHDRDSGSVARIEKLIADGSVTHCYASALRTPERETFAVFSDPVMRRLPSRLIVRAEKLALLKSHQASNGQIQLASLVNDARLKGAVTNKRNYGLSIDPVLASAKAPYRAADSTSPGRMLMMGRVDWIISEPAELAWLVRDEAALPRGATRSFPIEGSTDPVLTHVMCSANAVGRQLVKDVNRLMTSYADRPWELPYLTLLDDAERVELVRLHRSAR